MEDTKIVILDADYSHCVLGLLTVKGKTSEEVEEIIDYVKQNVDYWTWEDILAEFGRQKLTYTWEEVNSVAI